jgi:DNA-binding MarR family transcriptional regulator
MFMKHIHSGRRPSMLDPQSGLSRQAAPKTGESKAVAAGRAVRSRSRLAKRAVAAFKARQLRNRFFAPTMFGEPAWDMLLALYLAEHSGRPVTVSGLANWSGYPPTTGLRWLQLLESESLVRRRPSPNDKRMFFVELTARGRNALDEFFSRAPTI